MKISLSKPNISEKEKQAVLDVLSSGWLTHGPKNKEFESLFSGYIGVRNSITLNSCASSSSKSKKYNTRSYSS
jgi:dTDP-4-amino-4,6-dideoxygalactose transaminase